MEFANALAACATKRQRTSISMTSCMTDAELTAYLNITPEEAAIILPKLTPERRAVYDRMKQVEIDAALWVEGLGPKPTGVLIDTERATKRRKAWR